MEAASAAGMEAQSDLAELRRKSQIVVNDSTLVEVDLEGGGGGGGGGGGPPAAGKGVSKGYINAEMITQMADSGGGGGGGGGGPPVAGKGGYVNQSMIMQVMAEGEEQQRQAANTNA